MTDHLRSAGARGDVVAPSADGDPGAASGGGDLVARWDGAVLHNYGTPAVALVRGDGAVVTDEHGRDYLDLFGGIAVNALGHAHPAIVSAVGEQIATLGHVGNFFANPPQVALAERLLALFDRPGHVYYANSGTEANEAAFKLSRRTGRSHIVSTVDAFHGRTMGALALTGQPSKAAAFAPLPGEVTHVRYGDADALAAAVTDETAMVILEPVQGEAGVVPAPPGYLTAARAITEAHGALLCLDEIQTGVGRTGHWFAHQAEGVRPDVVTLAKGLGGGLPLGACVAFTDTAYGDVAALLPPGSHGSTFGGNPVCCAAGLAVLTTIADEHLLDHATKLGEHLRDGVAALGHPAVAGVRGTGLLLGIVLTGPTAPAAAAALRDAGFLVNPCQPDVLRLAPPLTLTTEQADSFLAALPAALDPAGAPADGRPAARGGAAAETVTDTAGGTQ